MVPLLGIWHSNITLLVVVIVIVIFFQDQLMSDRIGNSLLGPLSRKQIGVRGIPTQWGALVPVWRAGI